MEPATINQNIILQLLPIAEFVSNLHFERNPYVDAGYGSTGRQKYTDDVQDHLLYLAQAVRSESKTIFTSHLRLAQVMLQSRNIPWQYLLDNLADIGIACKQLLPGEDYKVVADYIREGIQTLNSDIPKPVTCFSDGNPLLPEARQYLALLLGGRRKEAQALVLDLANKGCAVADIYEYIFKATQYEVGILWQTNQITEAHEHYCTAATQLIMTTLYPYIFDAVKKGNTMVTCTVSGDLHELGIRMISDLFEMDGWDTYYMGANMPDAHIITAIKEKRADMLAISVTMPFHTTRAEGLIRKIREDSELKHVKIIVGGYPFSLVPDLWSRIGADGAAATAKDAIQLANSLVSSVNKV